MGNEMMLTVAKLFSNSGISWSVNEERDRMTVFGSDGSEYVFQKISSDLRNEQGRFVVNGQNVVMNSKRKINGKMVSFTATGITMYNGSKNSDNGGANSIMLEAGTLVCNVEHHARGLHGIGADVEAQKMMFINNDILGEFDEYRMILREDIHFVSISAATTFILGRFANGYEHWDLV